MKRKLFSLIALFSSLLFLCVCAVTIAVVDPYAHYHPVALPLTDNPAYTAPGIARNYAYDTVVLGSSMVENTPVSRIDTLWDAQSVKIPLRGGNAGDHARVLDLCLETHDVKRVIFCMDPTSFSAQPSALVYDYPAYLWNGAGLDDVNYLLNASVLLDKIRLARRGERQLAWYATDRDAMYTWTDVEFTRENAINSYSWPSTPQTMRPADYFADSFHQNVEADVERFVAAHPETEFHFYYPPYSVIYWILVSDEGNLNAQLWMRERFVEALCAYPNVVIHDFAAYTPWILDLDRYMDYSHHDMEMNAQIIEAIVAGTHRVTDVQEVIDANAVLRQEVAAFKRPR